MKATLTINYTDGTEENDIEIELRSSRGLGEVMDLITEHEEELGKEASSFVLVVSL